MATTEPVKRKTLNRATIVAAALARADADGLEAVSFRRLAADLGVTPMALYRYVASKDELLVGVMDAVFAKFDLPPDPNADWRDQLRDLARTFRRLLLSHPAAAKLGFADVDG